MAYRATVIPIMIASPGDVTEEREIVRSVIHDWNDVNAESSGIMLAAVGWDSHSSPELGERPQELINRRVLENCDLLIGVFWTRLGTPTGKSQSGTVEEIEEHVDAGKPAMIYFSSKPVAPESIDPEQYKQVNAFKDKLKPQGLIETYENLDEFQKKLTKQLQLCLSKNEYLEKLVKRPTIELEPQILPEAAASTTYHLSEAAQEILKTAASCNGTIIMSVSSSGRTIQTGGKSFGGGHGREAAKWEHALKELVQEELAIARGYKGEVFELTHVGWEVADAF